MMAQITTKEKIEVMQAFLDGKDVQRKDIQRKLSLNGDGWSDFTGEPIWNWLEFDYRIKPTPKYRPYSKVNGDWLGRKVIYKKTDSELEMLISTIMKNNKILLSGSDGITYYKHYIYFEEFYNDYTWADGSPCGELPE